MSEVGVVGAGQTVEEVETQQGKKRVPYDGAAYLQQVAKRSASENMKEIIGCLLYNIKNMAHMPSLKLLFDIIGFKFEENSAPEEAYDSLAKVLMGVYQKELAGVVLNEPEKRLVIAAKLDLGTVLEGKLEGTLSQE